jgi:predicted benzoate:H+ symporter BenE
MDPCTLTTSLFSIAAALFGFIAGFAVTLELVELRRRRERQALDDERDFY